MTRYPATPERRQHMRVIAVAVTVMVLVATGVYGGGYPESFNYNQNTNNQEQGQFQGQGQAQGQKQGMAQAQNNGQTISPSQSISFDGNTYLGEYPSPWTTPMPHIQTPNTGPKTWQLSLSMWHEKANWTYQFIGSELPANVEKHGRLFTLAGNRGNSVTIYKTPPKGAIRLGTYVMVAKVPTVDATVLEEAAMVQAKEDFASGIVERERYYFAKNNQKGGAIGAGLAINALGSLFQKMAEFGPYMGGQYGSYVSDQDLYCYLAFDTIEVR
jgi:hypothetical protein